MVVVGTEKVFATIATAQQWLAENPNYEIARNRGGFLVWVRRKSMIHTCHLGHRGCSYTAGGSCWALPCRCELGPCEACP